MQARALYHLMPEPMIGDRLYPLNTLKHLAPEAFEKHRKKYDGRESLLDRQIPPLHCRWNDVLHLSPVHPALIREAKRKLGLFWPAKGRQVGVVCPEQLGMTSENTVIWPFNDTRKVALHTTAEPFLPYDPVLLDDLSEVPDRTIRYLEEAAQTDAPTFLFVGIPHILFRGTIRREDITVITV
jgi:hypothetical protein